MISINLSWKCESGEQIIFVEVLLIQRILCGFLLAVDGGWAVWTNWDACSVTCGYGTQRRSRTCTNPSPEYGGLDCSGTSQETMKCFGGNCTGTYWMVANVPLKTRLVIFQ